MHFALVLDFAKKLHQENSHKFWQLYIVEKVLYIMECFVAADQLRCGLMGRALGARGEKWRCDSLESNGNWANIDESVRVMEIDRTRSLLTGDKFAVIGRTSVMGLQAQRASERVGRLTGLALIQM